MQLSDAVILGLVEGITEYLPISSTGHLILVQWLLGLQGNHAVNDFNIIIQGGAILAVLGLYRTRVTQMVRGIAGRDSAGLRLFLNLVVAFLPAAVLGVLLDDWIDSHLFRPQPVLIAIFLGGMLLLAIGPWQRRLLHQDRDGTGGHFRELEDLTWKHALIVGLLQCIAMCPGTSRSMMTIVGGMLVGLRPRQAAEFSFLLGLPTLGGACVYKLAKHLRGDFGGFVDGVGGPTVMLVGMCVACVAAAIAIKWLVGYLTRHGFAIFGWYRIVLGAALLIAVLQGWVSIEPKPLADRVGDVTGDQVGVAHADGLAHTEPKRVAQLGQTSVARADGVR